MLSPNTVPQTSRMHPMLWIAAGSVTLFSLTGIAALTGVLPIGHASAPQSDAMATQPPGSTVSSPVAPIAPVAAASEPAAPVASPAKAPAEMKPAHVPSREVAHTTTKPVKHHESSKTRPIEVAHSEEAQQRPASTIPTRAPDTSRPVQVARCDECGVVESVRVVEHEGQGTGLGAIGGAILGGVLGHQVGEGTGKQVARIGGAILGGFAGNEAEKRIRKTQQYEITVQMDDGSRRTLTQTNGSQWHAGDKVRVESGTLVSRHANTASGAESDPAPAML
ncbi:glycine zipper 2TM domain-containing protein [Niveibacterium umoris]|uniref:Outer membrane lipoprotein SlyB n=1 Tax=Niveibacterium umoris TaxID=1193620 RepID=A0A840BED7_9RHOO|nr:glycine zipper 2TM domain-containing protein [Niveibacterium umoris]MBB4011063.1 outer membrane lipoprotein SlyB [Niveibacterium umoris]